MKKLSFKITLASVTTTLVILLFAVGSVYTASSIAFIFWALSPYILLAMLINLVSSKPAIITGLIITILTCLFGIAMLYNNLFINAVTLDEPILMSIPLWQWAALIILALPLTLLNIVRRP